MSKTCFMWDPIEDNIVKEFDGGGIAVVEYSTEPQLYGDIIARRTDGVTGYYHFDALGSVVGATDATQDTIGTTSYSAFGVITESTGINAIRFHFVGRSGYISMTSSSEYCVRHRVYNAPLARWLSFDPLYSTRIYVYVDNRTTRDIDPSGLGCTICFLATKFLGTHPKDASKDKIQKCFYAFGENTNDFRNRQSKTAELPFALQQCGCTEVKTCDKDEIGELPPYVFAVDPVPDQVTGGYLCPKPDKVASQCRTIVGVNCKKLGITLKECLEACEKAKAAELLCAKLKFPYKQACEYAVKGGKNLCADWCQTATIATTEDDF